MSKQFVAIQVTLCLASWIAEPQQVASSPVASAQAETDSQKLLTKLHQRASKWLNARKQDPLTPCKNPRCDDGLVRGGDPNRGFTRNPVPCARCDGTGKECSRERFEAQNAFHSPHWQQDKGIRSALEDEFATLTPTEALERRLMSFSIRGKQLVDETHAVVVVLEGNKLTVESRWILVTEPTRQPEWYLWSSEGVDGEWPEPAAADDGRLAPEEPIEAEATEEGLVEGGEAESLDEAAGAPPRDPLDPEQRSHWKDVFGGTTECWNAVDYFRSDRTFHVRLELRALPADRTLRRSVQLDTIACARAVAAVRSREWDTVRLDFASAWEHESGKHASELSIEIALGDLAAIPVEEIDWEHLVSPWSAELAGWRLLLP